MSQTDPIKARLIDAAGAEFAEKGFEGATIRSICRRAGANLAAVNYHFGDKERLYEETLLSAHACVHDSILEKLDLDAPAADRLQLYIRGFLSDVMGSEHRGSWHNTLMVRELLQPTAAVDTLVRVSIRPRFERLFDLLRELCPEADDRRLHAAAFGIVGQILHYKAARAISERLIGVEAYRELDLEYLTDHITNFSLAGLGLSPLNVERNALAHLKGGA